MRTHGPRFFICAKDNVSLFSETKVELTFMCGYVIDCGLSNGSDDQYIESGWLPCDGREYDPIKYSSLKRTLKDVYGENRLPDLREK